MQTKLILEVCPDHEKERQYIASVLMSEFLGIEIELKTTDRCDVRIFSPCDGRELLIDDTFFAQDEHLWRTSQSLPPVPLKFWDLSSVPIDAVTINKQIPIIFGKDPCSINFFKADRNCLYLGLDVFGSCFFMLTCYEEIVKLCEDEHGRFPGKKSLAYQQNFLDRPIVNEYLEILWSCLKYLWPSLQRKTTQQFKIHATHDIDNPFEHAFKSLISLSKNTAGDIIKRFSLSHGYRRIKEWCQVSAGNLKADPYNTFDRIMEISEKNNLRSTFNFIAVPNLSTMDGEYTLNHPLMRQLLRKINCQGHEIGLHASYFSYKDIEKIKREFDLLKLICGQEGISQNIWGVRQHYLRCVMPLTVQNSNDAGLSFDSTLYYADVAGFRCGTCYPFPLFNVITHETLAIKEYPLIVMESTILDEDYMNLGTGEEAYQVIDCLKDRCRLYNGDFTILWHNNRLIDRNELDLYQQVIKS